MNEPTEVTPSVTPEAPAAPEAEHTSRDELIAAANDATDDGDESTPKSTLDEEPKKKKEAAPVEEPKGIPHIAKVLHERKEKERARIELKEQQRSHHQKMEQERQAFAQQQAQLEYERQQVKAQREKLFETTKDPFKIAELTGRTHEQLAQDLMVAGTPEWQVAQRIKSEIEQLKAAQLEYKTQLEQQQNALKERDERAAAAHRQSTEQAFVEHTSSDKYPTLSRLTPKQRLLLGYDIAQQYYNETKRIASDAEIAEYLESSLSGQAGETRAARQPNGMSGNAPKSKATGPRTLSNSVASERRSSPKPATNNMSAEDMRQELILAAKEAMAKSV